MPLSLPYIFVQSARQTVMGTNNRITNCQEDKWPAPSLCHLPNLIDVSSRHSKRLWGPRMYAMYTPNGCLLSCTHLSGRESKERAALISALDNHSSSYPLVVTHSGLLCLLFFVHIGHNYRVGKLAKRGHHLLTTVHYGIWLLVPTNGQMGSEPCSQACSNACSQTCSQTCGQACNQ